MKLINRLIKFVTMYRLPVARDLRRSGRNSRWESAKVAWGAACAYWECRERK